MTSGDSRTPVWACGACTNPCDDCKTAWERDRYREALDLAIQEGLFNPFVLAKLEAARDA